VSRGDVVLLVSGSVFAAVGIGWLVRTALRLRGRADAPRALWVLVVERGAAWIVVGAALACGALGSSSLGHWLFLAAFVLFVVESILWQALLPRLAKDFDEVFR
jgi:hypothetical protein